MTEEQAFKLVGMLTAAFPRQDVPQATVELYVQYLVPLDVEAATAAVQRIIMTKTFFPAIAELHTSEREQRNTLRPTAEEAWALVKEQVRRVGSYGCFSGNPLVEEAVRLFDWQALCRAEHREEIANRAHFYRIYESVLDRDDAGYLDTTRPLIEWEGAEPEQLDQAPRAQLEKDARAVLSEILTRHEARVAAKLEGERKPYADD